MDGLCVSQGEPFLSRCELRVSMTLPIISSFWIADVHWRIKRDLWSQWQIVRHDRLANVLLHHFHLGRMDATSALHRHAFRVSSAYCCPRSHTWVIVLPFAAPTFDSLFIFKLECPTMDTFLSTSNAEFIFISLVAYEALLGWESVLGVRVCLVRF